MFYDTAKNDHGLPYSPFKALAVPRPIGWISTISKDGIGNLAPFSFYNALRDKPPFIMISAECKLDGSKKDTVRNVEETGELVFNMATWDTRKKMSETSWIEDPAVDELTEVGLTPLPSKRVRPVRIAESPVHFECLYHDTYLLPGNDVNSVYHVVIAKVIGVHIDDDYITEDGQVDVLKIKPIARMGYMDYTAVENSFVMSKHTMEKTLTPKPG